MYCGGTECNSFCPNHAVPDWLGNQTNGKPHKLTTTLCKHRFDDSRNNQLLDGLPLAESELMNAGRCRYPRTAEHGKLYSSVVCRYEYRLSDGKSDSFDSYPRAVYRRGGTRCNRECSARRLE